MREVFNGWRRIAGCGASLAAIWMMMVWIRSLYFEDSLSTYTNHCYFTCSSRVGCFCMAIDELEFTGTGHLLGRRHGWHSDPRDSEIAADPGRCGLWIDMDTTGRKVSLFGFHISDFQTDSSDYSRKIRGVLMCIPYWGVVFPLGTLSVYLILWKPRKGVKVSPPQS